MATAYEREWADYYKRQAEKEAAKSAGGGDGGGTPLVTSNGGASSSSSNSSSSIGRKEKKTVTSHILAEEKGSIATDIDAENAEEEVSVDKLSVREEKNVFVGKGGGDLKSGNVESKKDSKKTDADAPEATTNEKINNNVPSSDTTTTIEGEGFPSKVPKVTGGENENVSTLPSPAATTSNAVCTTKIDVPPSSGRESTNTIRTSLKITINDNTKAETKNEKDCGKQEENVHPIEAKKTEEAPSRRMSSYEEEWFKYQTSTEVSTSPQEETHSTTTKKTKKDEGVSAVTTATTDAAASGEDNNGVRRSTPDLLAVDLPTVSSPSSPPKRDVKDSPPLDTSDGSTVLELIKLRDRRQNEFDELKEENIRFRANEDELKRVLKNAKEEITRLHQRIRKMETKNSTASESGNEANMQEENIEDEIRTLHTKIHSCRSMLLLSTDEENANDDCDDGENVEPSLLAHWRAARSSVIARKRGEASLRREPAEDEAARRERFERPTPVPNRPASLASVMFCKRPSAVISPGSFHDHVKEEMKLKRAVEDGKVGVHVLERTNSFRNAFKDDIRKRVRMIYRSSSDRAEGDNGVVVKERDADLEESLQWRQRMTEEALLHAADVAISMKSRVLVPPPGLDAEEGGKTAHKDLLDRTGASEMAAMWFRLADSGKLPSEEETDGASAGSKPWYMP
eukprot:g3376.t1